MSQVVTFVDYQPEPRYDGVPWTQIKIEEAVTSAGPWNLIDTQALVPDTDPSNPQIRNFTTHNAQLTNGWYRITFLDASGNDQLPTAPVQMSTADQLSYTPTISQVALKILSRTRDNLGNEIGTFTNGTRPTDDEVAAIAVNAAGKVSLSVGDEIPQSLISEAQDVAAIRAAMDVELTYFSDQVNTGRSIYPQLAQQYQTDLAALLKGVQEANNNNGQVVATAAATKPQYNFPDATNCWITRRW